MIDKILKIVQDATEGRKNPLTACAEINNIILKNNNPNAGEWQPTSIAEAQAMVGRCNAYLHHKILGDQRVGVSLPLSGKDK